MKQNKVILSIVTIFFGLLVLGSCSAVTTYNGLVGEQTKVEQAQADVSTALQRRSDLIGNLVESVKGQMNHETEVFTKIADARAKIGSSSVTSEENQKAHAYNCRSFKKSRYKPCRDFPGSGRIRR